MTLFSICVASQYATPEERRGGDKQRTRGQEKRPEEKSGEKSEREEETRGPRRRED